MDSYKQSKDCSLNDVAASYQKAIIDCLVAKMKLAINITGGCLVVPAYAVGSVGAADICIIMSGAAASTIGAPSNKTQGEDVHVHQRPDEERPKGRKRGKIRTVHLVVPYAVGLAWFLLHPIVSVVTGQASAKRWASCGSFCMPLVP